MKEEKFHYGPVEERGRPAVGYIRQLSLSSVCSLLAATERERERQILHSTHHSPSHCPVSQSDQVIGGSRDWGAGQGKTRQG